MIMTQVQINFNRPMGKFCTHMQRNNILKTHHRVHSICLCNELLICSKYLHYNWTRLSGFIKSSGQRHMPPKRGLDRNLDLWQSDLKINRSHVPVMINVPMKFHDIRPKRSWVIIRKPFAGRTDRRTDMCNTIYPLFFEGGHNKLISLSCWYDWKMSI